MTEYKQLKELEDGFYRNTGVEDITDVFYLKQLPDNKYQVIYSEGGEYTLDATHLVLEDYQLITNPQPFAEANLSLAKLHLDLGAFVTRILLTQSSESSTIPIRLASNKQTTTDPLEDCRCGREPLRPLPNDLADEL